MVPAKGTLEKQNCGNSKKIGGRQALGQGMNQRSTELPGAVGLLCTVLLRGYRPFHTCPDPENIHTKSEP